MVSRYPPPKPSEARLAFMEHASRERAIREVLRNLGVLDDQTRRRVLIAAMALYGIELEDLAP